MLKKLLLGLLIAIFGLHQVQGDCNNITTTEMAACLESTETWRNFLPHEPYKVGNVMSTILENLHFCPYGERLKECMGVDILDSCVNIGNENYYYFKSGGKATIMALAQLEYVCDPKNNWAIDNKIILLKAMRICSTETIIYNNYEAYVNCVRNYTEEKINIQFGCFSEKVAAFQRWYETFDFDVPAAQISKFMVTEHISIMNRCKEDLTCFEQECNKNTASKSLMVSSETSVFYVLVSLSLLMKKYFEQ